MIIVYVSDTNAFPSSESYIQTVLSRFHDIPSPVVLKTENGKPYVEGNQVHFSLSHTKEKIFLAVSPSPVGIDAEKSDRIIHESVAKRHFPTENFPNAKALVRRWIQMESKVKFLGSTLSKELSSPSKERAYFFFHETTDHLVCVCCDKLEFIVYKEL